MLIEWRLVKTTSSVFIKKLKYSFDILPSKKYENTEQSEGSEKFSEVHRDHDSWIFWLILVSHCLNHCDVICC